MTVLNEVLTAVIALAQIAEPRTKIRIGALPANNGLALSPASGAPRETYLDKGEAYRLPILLNGKHTSQQAVSEMLNGIHAALSKAVSYPVGKGWQITNISTTSAPEPIGREENQQYLYGSSLEVRFYYKGVT